MNIEPVTGDAVNELLNGTPDEAPAVDDGIKRDRYGRYVIPNRDTGQEEVSVRATTYSNLLEDFTGLKIWEQRKLARGIGLREDLFALLASLGSDATAEDKAALDTVIEQAKEAAGISGPSNLGTALHRFSQRLDLGEAVDVPAQWSRQIAAYLAAFRAYGLWTYEQFIEFVVVIPQLQAAGTVDRLLMGDGWDKPRVADLKTGKIEGKERANAIQLAEYANAPYWYDPKTNTFHDMPDVDKEVGILIHLPVDGDGCYLYEVDLVQGYRGAELARDVYQWRRVKGLSKPLSKWSLLPDAPASVAPITQATKPKRQRKPKPKPVNMRHLYRERRAWVKAYVAYIVQHGQAQSLARLWSEYPEILTFPNGGPQNNDELDRIAGLCRLVEMEASLSFFSELDPAKIKVSKWISTTTNETNTQGEMKT